MTRPTRSASNPRITSSSADGAASPSPRSVMVTSMPLRFHAVTDAVLRFTELTTGSAAQRARSGGDPPNEAGGGHDSCSGQVNR